MITMASMSAGQDPTAVVLNSPDWVLRTASDAHEVRAVSSARWSWPAMEHQRRNFVRFDLPIPTHARLDLGSVRYDREVNYAFDLSHRMPTTVYNLAPDGRAEPELLLRDGDRVFATGFPLEGREWHSANQHMPYGWRR